ncbi:MAG: MarR family winged helix-turn-helix transcriptional regulator [Pararhodobacter sp.]
MHLARLVHGNASDGSLTPAQWTALRYFATANRFSRTPSAFSEFNATTRGTASQTVKCLIAMGLLEKRAHESDGRSFLIEITEEGRARLAGDPLDDLIGCIRDLPPARRAAFTRTLADLIEAMARLRSAPTFGKCGDCGHCDTSKPDTAFCRCTRSLLGGPEMNTLCVDFAPGNGRR